MKASNPLPTVATRFGFAVRRAAGIALTIAIVMAFCPTRASAQETQVTIEGTITNAGSVPGIAVGDKYSMVVYYNPSQSPVETIGSDEAYYTGFTLNAVVDDTHGNQLFSNAPGEQLFVQDEASGNDQFISTPCCSGDNSGAGFVLIAAGGKELFKTVGLPTAIVLADFDETSVAFGNTASGKITSIKVVNTGGAMVAFVSAGLPDPNGKVPAIDAVAGAGVQNLDISMPLTLLTHGTTYVYVVALQDVNFTGTCDASFTLTQVQYNKTVTLDSGKVANFSCSPNSTWAWAFSGKAIPNFPGPATLTGTVTYGSEKATSAATLVFQ